MRHANPDRTDKELVDLVASNLCRCTGHAGIVRTARHTADARRAAITPGSDTADSDREH